MPFSGCVASTGGSADCCLLTRARAKGCARYRRYAKQGMSVRRGGCWSVASIEGRGRFRVGRRFRGHGWICCQASRLALLQTKRPPVGPLVQGGRKMGLCIALLPAVACSERQRTPATAGATAIILGIYGNGFRWGNKGEILKARRCYFCQTPRK